MEFEVIKQSSPRGLIDVIKIVFNSLLCLACFCAIVSPFVLISVKLTEAIEAGLILPSLWLAYLYTFMARTVKYGEEGIDIDVIRGAPKFLHWSEIHSINKIEGADVLKSALFSMIKPAANYVGFTTEGFLRIAWKGGYCDISPTDADGLRKEMLTLKRGYQPNDATATTGMERTITDAQTSEIGNAVYNGWIPKKQNMMLLAKLSLGLAMTYAIFSWLAIIGSRLDHTDPVVISIVFLGALTFGFGLACFCMAVIYLLQPILEWFNPEFPIIDKKSTFWKVGILFWFLQTIMAFILHYNGYWKDDVIWYLGFLLYI